MKRYFSFGNQVMSKVSDRYVIPDRNTVEYWHTKNYKFCPTFSVFNCHETVHS